MMDAKPTEAELDSQEVMTVEAGDLHSTAGPPVPSTSTVDADPDREAGDLHSAAGPLVPSTSTVDADPDRESLAVQRTRPNEVPVFYSAARLQTERGVVELPAPPASIHVNTSGDMSGNITGVAYDMSTRNVYNVDRAVFTRDAVQEIARQLRSGSHPAIQSGSSSGNAAEGIARLLMPGTRSADTPDFSSVTDVREETEPTFPSALLECKIRALKEDFVETAFFQDVERRLLEQGVAVVVGPTGEGKSTNAIMLCDKLRGQGFLTVYFQSLDEIDTDNIARCRRNLCVVIDNVFGTSILDAANLRRWSQILSDLIDVQTAGRQGGGQGAREEGSSCSKKSLLLLLLSRDNVFSEALDKATKFPLLLRDQASRISMKSADNLQEEEKRQLVRKYVGKVRKGLTEKEENDLISCDVPIGFPQVCRLHNELKIMPDKRLVFFSKPIAMLLEDLKEMMREDVMVRAALALLVLQGGSLPLQNLQLQDKREACGINTALGIIGKELGDLDSEGDACQQLLKTIETLCGGLLTLETGKVSFSHDSVRDAVCVALADRSLPFVAGHCSLAVLSQCILLDDTSTSSSCKICNQSVLSVPRALWPLLTKRLVSELEKGKCREVFTCGLLSHSRFCRELADACLKSSTFSEMVHEVDVDCGLNFLFWASMVSPNVLTRLLPKCQFKGWELWQGIIGCCVQGHAELIKCMHRSLPEKSVEDWSTPISSWFLKRQIEDCGRRESQSRWRPSSTECKWNDLPVGRHAIPGNVAAEHSHVSVMKTLLELGMPANVMDPKKCTPLMSACSGGQKEAVAFLVSCNKADLTAADSRGSTPLHKLAEGGHDDIACWLVEEHMDDNILKACINKVNDDLQTPIMLACRYAPKLATFLLAQGAETGKRDVEGKSCLHFAAEAGMPGLLEKLLDLKTMDVKQESCSGWSPLHFACSRPENLNAVQTLLRCGAEAKPRENTSTETPLHVAVRQGCLETVQALVESSSDVIAACDSVKTTSPFLLACKNGNKEVVQYLHKKKADVSKKNEDDYSSLHFAVMSGNVDTVQYVMEETGVDVDVRSKYARTPLLQACLSGKVIVVKYLREKNADLTVVDVKGDTALHLAACSGNVDTVQYVMDETCVDVDVRNKYAMTPLLLACQSGKVEAVKYLREKNADLTVVNVDSETALHWAAWSGNFDTMEYVMDETGVDVNVRNKYDRTPLLFACESGKLEAVKYLREKNADLTDVDVNGNRAIHLASLSGNIDTVQYVMDETGVDVNMRNKSSRTPLLLACLSGKWEAVKYLREKKADLTVVDVDGHTALHWAAWSGNVDTMEYVMDVTGVDVDVRIKSVRTPLLVACESGKVEAVKYLRKKNADLTVVTEDGDRALHFAVWSGNVDTVQYVMDETGVDVDVRNKSGKTPLLRACGSGKVEVVKYLREKNADLTVADVQGNTALHLAAKSGDMDTVRCLVEDNAMDVVKMNTCGSTAASMAQEEGHAEVMEYLNEKVKHIQNRKRGLKSECLWQGEHLKCFKHI